MAVDATRRTHLANERTARLVADRARGAGGRRSGSAGSSPTSPSTTTWPYVVAGVGFALWGMGRGRLRQRPRGGAVERALKEGEVRLRPAPWVADLTISGVALGLLTAVLIVFD